MPAKDDDVFKRFINTLDVPDVGTDAPELEKITPKKTAGRKFFVQKIVTEIYVYTDIKDHVFAEASFQDMFILGEMTEAKLKRLLQKRTKESS